MDDGIQIMRNFHQLIGLYGYEPAAVNLLKVNIEGFVREIRVYILDSMSKLNPAYTTFKTQYEKVRNTSVF